MGRGEEDVTSATAVSQALSLMPCVKLQSTEDHFHTPGTVFEYYTHYIYMYVQGFSHETTC